MTKKQWHDLRMFMPQEVDRVKLERKLRKYYKLRGWKDFSYMVVNEAVDNFRLGENFTWNGWNHRNRDPSAVGRRRLEQHAADMHILGARTEDPLRHAFQGEYLSCRYSGGLQDDLKYLIKNCLELIPHPDVPKVLLKPKFMTLDAEGRLHNETGPAIIWHNGRRAWWWHGVRATQKFVEEPPTVAYINRQDNQERKRVLIERFGPDKYLKAMNAQKVNEGPEGILWRVGTAGWGEEDIVMIQVTNATAEPDGTFREFFLRVPASMTTVKDAVAWTFGKDSRTFKVVEAT